jgi:hypothetical protein
MNHCEACQKKEVDIIDTDRESAIPYKLCKDCHTRLINLALRPLEYFNLVAKHGHEYELHDDFYDNDGNACQPKIPVENDEALAFPKLPELKGNLQGLLDFATVKWSYPDEVTGYLQRFNKNEILRELDIRLSYNPQLLERFLDIVSSVMKTEARGWVIFQYKNYVGNSPLIFSKALAECLPFSEGFEIVKNILDTVDSSKLHASVWALNYFHSPQILTWFEENKDRIINISTNYGDVCAANQFDWNTAKRWLKMGRPLSLIALDAIFACGTTEDKVNRNFFLRQNPPRLLNPDTVENMNQILDDYLKTDNVHRTRVTVEAIKNDWRDIMKIS